MANNEMSMESIDSGSNYSFGDKMIMPNTAKSGFNLSNLSTMTIENAGIVFPICEPIETVMGDDFDINVKTLLRVLPQEIPLYSRQRLYIYAFYARNSDLWKNWNVFMRKGNIGQTIKEIPTLTADTNMFTGSGNTGAGSVAAGSLADFMGLPIGLNMTEWNEKINALPFFMYLKIWRDYFCNKNQFVNNKILFPDNDDDFRLDDDGNVISAKAVNKKVIYAFGQTDRETDKEYGIQADTNTNIADDTSGESGTDSSIICGLFYHNYPDDRFTDALPWPIRGSEPKIDIETDVSSTQPALLGLYDVNGNKLASQNIAGTVSSSSGFPYGGLTVAGTSGSSVSNIRYMFMDDSETYVNTAENTKLGVDGSSFVVQTAGITLNQIRELAIAQTELEKMARTDGTYLGFAMTFFGEKPKNAEDYRPVYIGGTYTDITFTEVLQTSSTSGESSPLGTYAGHGIAVNNDGYIGHVHCDDYGWIMLLGCIMPDVYYSQGLSKALTRHLQSDFYIPERAKMGMVPVLNHELWALNTGNDFNENFNMFAWNNPYDELRYRANEIHGKIADPNNISFSNYTQARFFDEKPNWGKEFSEASEVSKDYLSAGSAEVAYTAQFKIDIKAVRALPYKAIPAQII